MVSAMYLVTLPVLALLLLAMTHGVIGPLQVVTYSLFYCLACFILTGALSSSVWAATSKDSARLASITGPVQEGFSPVFTAPEAVGSVAQEEEKANLLKQLDRNHGIWSMHHPRHRLLDALLGYKTYRSRQAAELNRLRELYKSATKAQRSALNKHIKYSSKFDRVDVLLKENQKLCDAIVQNALGFYNLTAAELDNHAQELQKSGRKVDKTSVSQTLKHFIRDWAVAGLRERKHTFACILDTLQETFPSRMAETPIKALVPGAGLGRLAHEIAKLQGIDVTMNEWSSFMTIAYRFLESYPHALSSSLHPFADSWSHHATEEDMLRKVEFPDCQIDSSSVLLVEGDFVNAFKERKGTYDVVVTYFFIDTARNLMAYFDAIHDALKPGGYWINLGPLLYGTGPYVQLSLEEVIVVTEAMGFVYQDTNERCGPLTLEGHKVRGMEAVYNFDERALTTSSYRAQFWVAMKS